MIKLTHAEFMIYKNHVEKRYSKRQSVPVTSWEISSNSNGTVRRAMPKTSKDAKRLERLAKVIKKTTGT